MVAMVMQRDMTAGTNTKKPKGNFENAIHVFVHEVSKPRTKSVGTFMYSTYWNIPHLPGGGETPTFALLAALCVRCSFSDGKTLVPQPLF